MCVVAGAIYQQIWSIFTSAMLPASTRNPQYKQTSAVMYLSVHTSSSELVSGAVAAKIFHWTCELPANIDIYEYTHCVRVLNSRIQTQCKLRIWAYWSLYKCEYVCGCECVWGYKYTLLMGPASWFPLHTWTPPSILFICERICLFVCSYLYMKLWGCGFEKWR